VTVPADDGDLYFSTETYYQDLVPNECNSGIYQGNSISSPVVDITLYKDAASIYTDYKVYSDQFNYPLLVSTYNAGVVWRVTIEYVWYGSAAPDYTLKVYSKQALSILDSDGNTNVLNYDGSSPSAFTESTYSGMKNWYPLVEADDGIQTLRDIIEISL